jgi:hypothetical protein
VLTSGEFTDCGHIITPLGEEFGWGDPYEEVVLTEICKFGNFVEEFDS